jgi:hypothetical protein
MAIVTATGTIAFHEIDMCVSFVDKEKRGQPLAPIAYVTFADAAEL